MGGGKKGGSRGGGKKKKTPTKAQQMAKARIAAGKTISSVKAANKASMKKAAADRHAKFKQTRVQTFGGTRSDSSYSKKEQKRITDAGYSVQGYAKAKDNTYGTNIQSGQVPGQGGAMSQEARELAAKQLEAKRAEIAAEKKAAEDAKIKSVFNPGRLNSNFTAMMGSPSIQNWAGTSFDKASSWYNKGRLPNESKMSIKDLFRNDIRQQQQVGKFNPNRKLNFASYARGESNPFRGMPGYGSITGQGEVAGGFQSGPTPSVRQAIERPLKAAFGIGKFFVNPKAAILASVSAPTALADGTLDGKPTRFNMEAGGLNVGADEGGEATSGGKEARTLTARFKRPGFDTLAGGLDFATNDRYDFDNLGRGLFGFDAVTPSNVINDAMSIAQNKNLTINDMGTFVNTVKDITTSDDKLNTVKNIIANQDTTKTLLGPVYDQLRNSEIVDSLATKKLKLPDNYGEQLDATKGALETAYSSLGDDNKKNRKIISDLFIGKNPDLNLLKRAAEQFTNESETIANYGSKTNLAKFQDSFKENSPLFKGLNKDERGLKGSLGNWRLSNLGTKIVGRNLEGTDNFVDLASNIIDTAGTDRATQSFLKTIGADGAPTPKTIIEGLIPRFGANAAQGVTRSQQTGSNRPVKSLGINQQVAEELIPLVSRAQQSGTSAANLAQIQNTAYNNQMSLYGMNPNYFASIMQPSFNRPRARFRQVFNRGYF